MQLSTSNGLEYTEYARLHRFTQYDTSAIAHLAVAEPNYAPLAGGGLIALEGSNLSPLDVHTAGLLRCAFGATEAAGTGGCWAIVALGFHSYARAAPNQLQLCDLLL